VWNGLDGEDEVEGYDKAEQIFFFRSLGISEERNSRKERNRSPKNGRFFMSLNIYANFYTIIK
jgi:hypothetical protein